MFTVLFIPGFCPWIFFSLLTADHGELDHWDILQKIHLSPHFPPSPGPCKIYFWKGEKKEYSKTFQRSKWSSHKLLEKGNILRESTRITRCLFSKMFHVCLANWQNNLLNLSFCWSSSLKVAKLLHLNWTIMSLLLQILTVLQKQQKITVYN